MRALSVRQPWANLIAAGLKTIETRTWATSYRGELLIVSSLKPNIEPAGFAVATAFLTDCRPMKDEDWVAARCPAYPGAWGWHLVSIQKILPFPVKGKLGIYKVSMAKGLRPDGPRQTLSRTGGD